MKVHQGTCMMDAWGHMNSRLNCREYFYDMHFAACMMDAKGHVDFGLDCKMIVHAHPSALASGNKTSHWKHSADVLLCSLAFHRKHVPQCRRLAAMTQQQQSNFKQTEFDIPET